MTHPVPLPEVSDAAAPRFPVSIKGVLFLDGKSVLLRNERDEWELPGGKLEPGEAPRDRLQVEIEEELALPVHVGPILDCWLYPVRTGVEVLIVTYLCLPADTTCEPSLSNEHRELALFKPGQIEALAMPDGYKASIARARLMLR